jgi:hypothetical protein
MKPGCARIEIAALGLDARARGPGVSVPCSPGHGNSKLGESGLRGSDARRAAADS